MFTATSSQGLLHAFEVLYADLGLARTAVLVNVSRALAAPITLESDHNDVLARAGFRVSADSCGDLPGGAGLDLMAYKIAEDERVMLLVIVNWMGLRFRYPRAGEPSRSGGCDGFCPFRPSHLGSRPHHLRCVGRGGDRRHALRILRHQMHLAAQNALRCIRKLRTRSRHRSVDVTIWWKVIAWMRRKMYW